MMIRLIIRIWQSYINREHNQRMSKLDDRLAAIKYAVGSGSGLYMTEEDLDEQRRESLNLF